MIMAMKFVMPVIILGNFLLLKKYHLKVENVQEGIQKQNVLTAI